MSSGWIKVHRKLLEWEWYSEPNTFRLFFHLILKANHKPKKYRGVTIKTGEIMTGLSLLSEQTGLSVQSIRTSIKRLKSTNEITSKTSSQGTIFQVVNYKKYQIPTNEITTSQQTTNKQLTTNNNDNNDKEVSIPDLRDFMLYIKSKVDEHTYDAIRGDCILKYNSWEESEWSIIQSNGKERPIKNWKTTILNTLPYIKKNRGVK